MHIIWWHNLYVCVFMPHPMQRFMFWITVYVISCCLFKLLLTVAEVHTLTELLYINYLFGDITYMYAYVCRIRCNVSCYGLLFMLDRVACLNYITDCSWGQYVDWVAIYKCCILKFHYCILFYWTGALNEHCQWNLHYSIEIWINQSYGF